MHDLTPQVTTAARIVFNNPDNQAAIEHFDLLKKQWSDNMERLRGLVDEAMDSTALIKAEGRVKLFPNKPWFLRVFKNTVGKGEIARNEHYPFPALFSTHVENSTSIKIENCCLQTITFLKSLKFDVWERVKEIFETATCGIYFLSSAEG